MGKMGSEEDEKTSLIQFLYKDIDIINSLYSQEFGGNTINVCKGTSTNTKSSNTVKGGLKIVSAGISSTDEEHSESTEDIDPHDFRAVQLINALMPITINKTLSNCKNGDILCFTGTTKLKDFDQISQFIPLLGSTGAFSTIEGFTSNQLQEIFKLMHLPLHVELLTNNDKIFVSIIEKFLTLTPNCILNMWGHKLPGQWTVIGIYSKREKPSPDSSDAIDSMLASVTELQKNIFPVIPYTIIPLMIYRNLNR